jgi:xanthine dehydrogenase accessory factor
MRGIAALREDKDMMERRQIVTLWKREPAGVLVTLVGVEGSSYRRPSARLLAGAGAAGHAGTISGGCLETEVIRRAGWIARDHAAVERYATTFDDTADIPFGLGCGGTVDLLFEPVAHPEGAALMQAMAESLEGRESTVVSFLPGDGRTLRRVIFDASGEVLFASPALSQHKIDCARGLSAGSAYEGRFVESLQAPQRLFVLGAGEDAKPLVDMAALLGWIVVVADGRSQLATTARFPRADRVSVLRTPGGEGLGIGPRDAVILMTHSYEQDRALLAGILPIGPRYLGLLGSRHRSSILLAEAAAMLGRTVESCCDRIFAPVGMDLGGDGPEAIALAIVAEVQASATGRIGGSRRLSAAEIAAQIELGGSSKYLQAQCALDLQ